MGTGWVPKWSRHVAVLDSSEPSQRSRLQLWVYGTEGQRFESSRARFEKTLQIRCSEGCGGFGPEGLVPGFGPEKGVPRAHAGHSPPRVNDQLSSRSDSPLVCQSSAGGSVASSESARS
jgi:hypothetical protein